MDPKRTEYKIGEERFGKVMETKVFRFKYYQLQIPRFYRVTREN